MTVAELHFFHADEPNGATIFECSTDDAFLKGLTLNLQRDSLGGGTVDFARKVPAGGLFQREIIEPEALVRVLIPEVHATKYFSGFFINPRQQKVISKAEKGGKGFTFGGPGPKHYLTRTLLWSASFAGFDNAVERDNHIWTWPSTARAGAILARLILEDQANPSGPFLPDLTKSFSDANDSDGVPWADDIAGNEDFTLRIGDDYLKILWQLEDAAAFTTAINLGEVGDPLLQLDAFQSYGRDLTGAVAADTVHFIEGLNIAADLDVEGTSYRKASHALVQGEDGVYELAVKGSWDPGELKKVALTKYDSSNNTVLDQAGRRFLQRQDSGEKQIELHTVTGFAPADGLYFPGEDGTDGHLWPGDIVSLTTGQGSGTALDYAAEDEAVTGIELELVEAVKDTGATERARSFDMTVFLNRERQGDSGASDRGTRGSTSTGPGSDLKLCRAATEGSDEITRLYPQFGNSSFNPGEDASWDVLNAGSTTSKQLAGTADPTQHQTYSATGGGSGVTTDVLIRQEVYTIDTDLAASLVAGGMVYRGQCTARARSGIGITEAAQDLISQVVIRVFDSGGTIRGTVLAGHTLSSSAGSVKWLANLAGRNAMFPPEAANDVLSALVGCVSGDRLVIEYGYRNFTVPAATGGSLIINGNAAGDLPEDETSQDLLNAWHQFHDAGVGATTGDLPLDTVRQGEESAGTSARASRCDHQHAHGLLAFDGTQYHDLAHVANYIVDGSTAPIATDDAADGYTLGSLWIDHSVSPNDVYILVDSTAGAAVWIEITPQTVAVTLNDLTDVTITAPATGDLLRYNGSAWVNAALPEATVRDIGHWEVVVSGTAPPVAVSNPADDDWVYAWVT